MSNPENADECLARKWLESQGYTNIKRLCLDPPDYVVGPAEEYAVEVRRLNQRVEVAGQYEGEEQSRIALRNTIEEVLEEFGSPTEGQVWIVDCEYDFSKSLPKTKITKGKCEKRCNRFRGHVVTTLSSSICAYRAEYALSWQQLRLSNLLNLSFCFRMYPSGKALV